MAMASGLYVITFSSILKDTLAKTVAGANNIVCLYTDTRTPVFGTDTTHTTNGEVASGTGYTQDTKTVGGAPTLTYASTNRLTYDWSTTVDWSTSTITARGMIIGAQTTLEPIVGVTFGSDYTSNNGTFSIDAHTDGIFYITMFG